MKTGDPMDTLAFIEQYFSNEEAEENERMIKEMEQAEQ